MTDIKSDIKILIVEDNLSFALDLEMMLDDLGYKSFKTVDNSEEALEYIFKDNFHLILMDIDIKGELSGTEIGKKIKHLNLPVIFLTSFDDEVNYKAANASNIAGYLIKPTNKFTLESTMNNAFKIQKNTNELVNESSGNQSEKKVFQDTIFIKKDRTYIKVFTNDISHIEAKGNFTLVHYGEDRFISNINFTKMKSLLTHDFFIQIHRSYIINFNYFSKINAENNTVTMEGGAVLSVSKSNKQKLLDKIRNDQ